jgi:hypothetical protein
LNFLYLQPSLWGGWFYFLTVSQGGFYFSQFGSLLAIRWGKHFPSAVFRAKALKKILSFLR